MGKYNYNKMFLDDIVFKFIYGCALRDAILEKSFIGKKDWISDVEEARRPVKTYIDNVLKGKYKAISEKTHKDHEDAFLGAAIEVCKAINDYGKEHGHKGVFHFGNAQKLINMTVKHIYTHLYSIHTLDYSTIRECFRYCHCPLDQEMKKKVWDSYGKIFGEKARRDSLSKGEEFHKAWGNEDFDLDEQSKDYVLPSRYMTFQWAVRKIISHNGGDIFPIEYDFIEWKT